jgi:hypothetical protein
MSRGKTKAYRPHEDSNFELRLDIAVARVQVIVKDRLLKDYRR